MYSGELEVQAKRKAIAVLQDEINRILNASRELATLPEFAKLKTALYFEQPFSVLYRGQ